MKGKSRMGGSTRDSGFKVGRTGSVLLNFEMNRRTERGLALFKPDWVFI